MNRFQAARCPLRSPASSFRPGIWVACFACLLVGCRSFHGNMTSERLAHGYTLVLPGILGEQGWDQNVAGVLADSPYQGAIQIHDWTHGPLLWGWNMFGSRHEVERIAARIVAYQDLFPERPVHIIGHSGGCMIVVQALETLPADRQIEKAVLLAPCVRSDYDLRRAMSHTRQGICAFVSPWDVPISVPLTGLRGLVDGELRVPAATVGFQTPRGLSESEARRYGQLLDQHRYSWDMLEAGHPGGHFGWTTPAFVAHHVVPQILAPDPAAALRRDNTNPPAPVSSH